MTGLEGVPVFEVSDGLFDSSSDFSGGSVADLVRFGLGWACWFLGGGDQVQAGVALVRDVSGMRGSVRVVVFDVEEAGLGEGPGVVDAAGERVTGLGRGAGQGAGDLEVDSGGVVLARVELWLVTPGPAGCRGAVDDQLGVGVEVVCGGDVVGQGVGDKGCPGGQDPRDGGLGDVEQFGEELLFEVVAQAGRDEPDALVEAEPAGSGRRQVAIDRRVDSPAQVVHLGSGQSCDSIRLSACPLVVSFHTLTISGQAAFSSSATRPTRDHRRQPEPVL